MIRWLADTNVVSEVRKKRPALAVLKWIEGIELDCLYTTSVTIAELRFGAMTHPSPAEAHTLTMWIKEVVRVWFKNRILEVGEESLLRWRIIVREAEQKQHPAPAVDLLIAAIALQHGMHVATRDTKPFFAAGVPVLNPWTGKRFNGA